MTAKLLPLAATLVLLAQGASAEGKLVIYNWTDYTSPELIAKFEKETGIEVTIDTFDTNETLLAKLQSGATGYDIIVPSHNFLPILIAQNLVMPIDAPKIAGYDNLIDGQKNPPWDPGNVYSVPWHWGTMSFTVNTDKVKGNPDDYNLIFHPPAEVQGKIGMMKSSHDVITMALIALGKPLCSEDPQDMQAVMDLLQQQKPFVKTYNSDGIEDRMTAGDVLIHQNWNGYSLRLRQKDLVMHYAFPPEGVEGWTDTVAVPVGAPDYDNALKFISFIMQPENIAIQSNYSGYANGVKGSPQFMNEAMRDAPEINPPDGTKIIYSQTCPPKAVDLQNRVWTMLFQ